MKPFEEQHTAWVDGQMTEAERTEFERSLPDLMEAESARQDLLQLRKLLRAEVAPPLSNGDFFNSQIQRSIEADRGPQVQRAERSWWSWLSMPQLVSTGVACLVAALAVYKFSGVTPAPIGPAGGYFAEIVDVRTEDPAISASTVYTAADNVTVLWIEGLDYLPASYTLQD